MHFIVLLLPLAGSYYGLRLGSQLHAICMAKGDGKNRRPKCSPRQSSAEPPAPPPRAGRISQDSLLSVRKQIAIVRAFRRNTAGPARPAVRTSFRKQSTKDAEITATNNTRRGPEVEVDLDLSVRTQYPCWASKSGRA